MVRPISSYNKFYVFSPRPFFEFAMFVLLLVGAVHASTGHHGHSPPLQHINESDIALYHAPTPPSYWSIDVDSAALDPPVYPRPFLIALHALFLSLAFFVALPVGTSFSFASVPVIHHPFLSAIALRSVNHPWHPFLVLCFYALAALGCTLGALYTNSYPNMYVIPTSKQRIGASRLTNPGTKALLTPHTAPFSSSLLSSCPSATYFP